MKQLNEVKRLQQLAGLQTKIHLQELDLNVPEDTDVVDFAKAVADLLKDGYGEHNFKSFLDTLNAELKNPIEY